MRMLWGIIVALVLATQSWAGTFASYEGSDKRTPETLAAALMFDDVRIDARDDAIIVSYTGLELPEPLAEFLTAAFPDLGRETLATWSPANISMAFLPDGSGTHIRLMVQGLPDRSVLLDERSGTCSGQVVLAHPGSADAATQDHLQQIRADGFEMLSDPSGTASFFIGYRPGCSVFLYVEPEPAGMTGSTVVLRYLED